MRRVLPVVLALSLSGCGAFMGRAAFGPSPFAGVRWDERAVGEAGELWFLLDMVPSGLLDTVLLPFDFIAWIVR